jgi:hypothetical protein
MALKKGCLWGCVSPELNIAVIAAKVLGKRKAKLVLVDAADYPWISEYRWFVSYKNYVVRNTWRNGKWLSVRLHRQVLGLVEGDGLIADHLNRQRLDCRRANLRVLSNYVDSAKNRFLPKQNCALVGTQYSLFV